MAAGAGLEAFAAPRAAPMRRFQVRQKTASVASRAAELPLGGKLRPHLTGPLHASNFPAALPLVLGRVYV